MCRKLGGGLGGKHFRNRFPQPASRRFLEQELMRSIEIHIAAVRVAHEGDGWVVVHEVTKAFLALAQGDLGSFPFRDVLNSAEEAHDPSESGVGNGNGRKANPADISLLG